MLVVVTGGAGSGKSEYAKAMVDKMCPEVKEPQFIRQYVILRNLHLTGEYVLLECIPDLLNQRIMEIDPASEISVAESVFEDIMYINRQARNLVIAVEEIFSDVVLDPGIRKYIEEMGKLNQLLVAKADAFVEVVYEIPIVHKGFSELHTHHLS